METMLLDVNIPFDQDFSDTSPERRERSTVHNKVEINAWQTENLCASLAICRCPQHVVARGSTGLRLSEFVQISECFQFYITDISDI